MLLSSSHIVTVFGEAWIRDSSHSLDLLVDLTELFVTRKTTNHPLDRMKGAIVTPERIEFRAKRGNLSVKFFECSCHRSLPPWESYEAAATSSNGYPLMPEVDIPWMNVRCARKKSTRIGSVITVVTAINWPG